MIIFDELDSFAAARGSYGNSGVEHSMVNQLLTEMDGFRDNELVFIVGTTNFMSALDPALLRPGRFEFHLAIPFPNAEDRRAIFQIHAKALGLKLTSDALDYAVRRTGYPVEGTDQLFSGDHIRAVCRTLGRRWLRERRTEDCLIPDIEWALTEQLERPKLTPNEERIVATHEAGHAVVALHCAHAPPVERISIRGDLGGSLGFVLHGEHVDQHVITRRQLEDRMSVLFGGREAERLLLEDVTTGAASDLERATELARALAGKVALGSAPTRVFDASASERALVQLEDAMQELLDAAEARARGILLAHRDEVEALVALLLEHKVVDRGVLLSIQPSPQTGPEEGSDG